VAITHPPKAAAEPAPPPRDMASPPWLARLAGRLGARLSNRAVPDAIDYAVAAGCFASFTLPTLLGVTSRIGSPSAVAGFGVLAAAPLIVRRRLLAKLDGRYRAQLVVIAYETRPAWSLPASARPDPQGYLLCPVTAPDPP
jgi:hypothetical protein